MATSGAEATRRALRSAVALAAVAMLAAGIAMLAQVATRDRIAAGERARRAAQLDALLGGLRHDNDLLADVTYARDADLLGTGSPVPMYRASVGRMALCQPIGGMSAPRAGYGAARGYLERLFI